MSTLLSLWAGKHMQIGKCSRLTEHERVKPGCDTFPVVIRLAAGVFALPSGNNVSYYGEPPPEPMTCTLRTPDPFTLSLRGTDTPG